MGKFKNYKNLFLTKEFLQGQKILNFTGLILNIGTSQNTLILQLKSVVKFQKQNIQTP